ncbi:MAG: SH3 domain-containing protein [Burkholderiales bacterium]
MKVLLRNGTRSARAELGRELGKGGAGRVYEVIGRPDLVAKVYFDPATRSPSPRLARAQYDRIDAMLRNPPRVGEPHQEGGRSFHQLAWPTDHVSTPSGEALGFAMPMLPLKHACDLEAILTRRSREREGLPHELVVRLFVARNLAAVVRELHRAGHFVIDMKPKNMSVYRLASPGLIALLDADGFCVYGGPNERYPAEMFTSEYIAPELLASNKKPTDAREEQDRWALAVIVFRLLNENIHPYSGRFSGSGNPTIDDNVRSWRYAYGATPHKELRAHPFSVHEFFDDDTRELFERAFGRDPYARPDAREWRDHLHQFTDASKRRLIQCRTDPSHWHFSKGCGLCYREGLLDAGKRGAQVSVPPGLWRAPVPPPAKPAPPPPRPWRSKLRSFAVRTLGVLLTLFALGIGLSVLLQMSLERTRPATPARTPGPVVTTQRQVSDRFPILNLRSGPGEGYAAIAQIPAGEMVTLAEVGRGPAGEWTKVTWRGKTGYVASSRLNSPSSASARDRTAAAPSPTDPGAKRTPPTNSLDRPIEPAPTPRPSKPVTTPRPADRPSQEPPLTTAPDRLAPSPPPPSSARRQVSTPNPADRASQDSPSTITPDVPAPPPPAPASASKPVTAPKPADVAAQGPAPSVPTNSSPREAGNDALLMECQGWVTKGRYALEDSSYDAAVALADHALRLRPTCPGAARLRQEAEAAKQAARSRNRIE